MTVKRVKTKAGENLAKALENLDGKVGKVGWIHSSMYIDGREYVAEVAAQNEFGNPNKHIPARPFMRPTISEKRQEWANISKQGAEQILKGNYDIGQVLELLGLKAAGDIRKKITQITSPPLAQSTIDARLAKRANKSTVGNLTKPLIDTGIMMNTLTNSVEDD